MLWIDTLRADAAGTAYLATTDDDLKVCYDAVTASCRAATFNNARFTTTAARRLRECLVDPDCRAVAAECPGEHAGHHD